MIDQVLLLTFINNQHDWQFSFIFRCINKLCKNIVAEWLTELLDSGYPESLDITQFRNLKKLTYNRFNQYNALTRLPHLTYLYVPPGCDMKDEILYHLRHLEVLYASHDITNKGIKHMKLTKLDISNNGHVTDFGIQHLNLHTLVVNPNITDNGISHMSNLRDLTINCQSHITDAGLKHLCLSKFSMRNNRSITNDGIKHMQLHTLLARNTTITDEGIKHMSLKVLNVGWTFGITNAGIKDMQLHELDADYNTNITDEGLKNMNITRISARGNPNITFLLAKNMSKCIVFDKD